GESGSGRIADQPEKTGAGRGRVGIDGKRDRKGIAEEAEHLRLLGEGVADGEVAGRPKELRHGEEDRSWNRGAFGHGGKGAGRAVRRVDAMAPSLPQEHLYVPAHRRQKLPAGDPLQRLLDRARRDRKSTRLNSS